MLKHAGEFSMERMARIMGVSREGFRKHLRAKGRAPGPDLVDLVQQIYDGSGKRYGAPKICAEIRAMGRAVTRKTVAKIMKLLGIKGVSRRKKKPGTTDSKHDGPIAPNLLERMFDCLAPNTVWVADITYLATRKGWVYLSLIVDLFSRRIVGWTLAATLHAEHTARALEKAIAARQPPPGLIFHSDRGSQYASGVVRRILERENMLQSMSRKGNCWDNAVAESTIGLIKAELTDRIFDNLEDAEKELFKYIEVFYNRQRRHSGAGNMAPAAYEEQMTA
jgi:transposase InsO family protein